MEVLVMSDKQPVRSRGYDLGGVEKAPGRNEYYLTIMRDGKSVGRVRVRAPMNPPTFYGDDDTVYCEPEGQHHSPVETSGAMELLPKP